MSFFFKVKESKQKWNQGDIFVIRMKKDKNNENQSEQKCHFIIYHLTISFKLTKKVYTSAFKRKYHKWSPTLVTSDKFGA